MPGRSGLQLPDNASPDCTSVQWMAETLPLKVFSSVHLPEKSAAEASPGTNAAATMKDANFMDTTPTAGCLPADLQALPGSRIAAALVSGRDHLHPQRVIGLEPRGLAGVTQ